MRIQGQIVPHSDRWNNIPRILGVSVATTWMVGIILYATKNTSFSCNDMYFERSFSCLNDTCRQDILGQCQEMFSTQNYRVGWDYFFGATTTLATLAVNVYALINLKKANEILRRRRDVDHLSSFECPKLPCAPPPRTAEQQRMDAACIATVGPKVAVCMALLAGVIANLFQLIPNIGKELENCLNQPPSCLNNITSLTSTLEDVVWKKSVSITKYEEKHEITGIIASTLIGLAATSCITYLCTKKRHAVALNSLSHPPVRANPSASHTKSSPDEKKQNPQINVVFDSVTLNS